MNIKKAFMLYLSFYKRVWFWTIVLIVIGSSEVFSQCGILYNVGGGGSFCSGSPTGVTITLSGSQTGLMYQLKRGPANVGSTIPGTGSALAWNNITTGGTYTVVANCGQPVTMNGSATVTAASLPTDYAVSAGGITTCGSEHRSITLTNSQSGVNYQLQRNGVNEGASLAGTGFPLLWQDVQSGTYTVIATSAGNCTRTMSTSATVSTTTPSIFTVGGGGSFCGSASVILISSETGVTYELKRNSAPTAQIKSGTGSMLTWSGLSTSGTYTISATKTSSSCTISMSGNAQITIIPSPTVFDVSGTTSICGTKKATITLSDSESGVSYQLLRNGVNVVTKAGTDFALTWNDLDQGGNYTIIGIKNTNGCTVPMSGTVVVVNNTPTVFNVGGGGFSCDSPSITLNGSQSGTQYRLYKNGQSVGTPRSGTGSALTWTFSQISAYQPIWGEYTIKAIGQCTVEMNGSASLAVAASYGMEGADICDAQQGTTLKLIGSQIGMNYQLQNNAINVGTLVAGTGGPLTWSGILTPGTYTVVGSSPLGNCFLSMGGIPVHYNPLQIYTVSGSATICEGSSSQIVLSDSQYNYRYQLRKDNVDIGPFLNGNGEGLIWYINSGGAYTVVATHNQASCSAQMSGTAVVNVHPVINDYALSGGGTKTPATSSFNLTLSGSQPGINYQLQRNGINDGAVLQGTGNALNWSSKTTLGIYTVVAVNPQTNCKKEMSVSTMISDPESTQQIINNLAFQYKYDSRNRMIAKRVPGAEWVYMVYDARDRLVMSQDGEQRKGNKWSYVKYDAFNRPIITGIYTHSSVLEQHQMASLISGANLYESFNGDALNHGYTNNVFASPDFAVSSFDILTVLYYDNYDFKTLINYPDDYNYKDDELTNQYSYDDNGNSFPGVRGLTTGGKIRELGSTQFLWNISYFDDHYRVVQQLSTIHTGGLNRETNVYDFTGKIMATQKNYGSSVGGHTIDRKYGYDHRGRLLSVWHKIDNQDYVLLLQNSYNELGEVIDKKLHSTNHGLSFKQSVDYRYNIRGWLTSINNSKLISDPETNDDTGDLFGMQLGYNASLGTGHGLLYNGNIGAMKWSLNQGLGTTKEQAYNFSYDPLNRIKSAVSLKYNEQFGGYWDNGSLAFSEKNLEYDLNGNLLKLTRYDKNGSLMDDIVYSYGSGSFKTNQLLRVADNGDKNNGFIDGANIDNDYSYDANGNMEGDKNKNVSSIQYNHLNLPVQVTKSNGEQLMFTYDAAGTKLNKKVYDLNNNVTDFSDYSGEAFMKGGELQFYHHDEGRVVMTGPVPEYQYHLKDHLGNVRMTFTTRDEVTIEMASLEPADEITEQAQFVRYAHARRVQSHLMDRTKGTAPSTTPGYAQRLSGGANEKYGLAKSLSVMPGDKINAEVYAKYVDPQSSNWSAALQTLMTQITAGANGTTVIDGGSYATATSSFPFATQASQNTSGSTEAGPKAYLNWLVFDRDFNFKLAKSGFDRLSINAKEQGQDVAHERLFSPEVLIDEPGYVYIYISNEEGTPLEVYFDDFKVVHVKSPVIQMDDYYPFGLTFNSYTREKSVAQNFKYNGIENEDELGLNINTTVFRIHDPAIGRWWQLDPKLTDNISPYSAMSSNPVLYSDPLGDTTWVFTNSGRFLRSIDVKESSNQVHFIDEGKFSDMTQLEGESNADYEGRVRGASSAFIGDNTIQDMKLIAGVSNAYNLEFGFVGYVGKDREIGLRMLNRDETNDITGVSVSKQLSDKYGFATSEFPLFGHTHPDNALHRKLGRDANFMSKERRRDEMLVPTERADYESKLRNKRGNIRSTPALLLTKSGFSVIATVDAPGYYSRAYESYLYPVQKHTINRHRK